MDIKLLKKLAEAHMPLSDKDEKWEESWKTIEQSMSEDTETGTEME